MRRGEVVGLGALLIGLALVTVAVEARSTALRLKIADKIHHLRGLKAEIMGLEAAVGGEGTHLDRRALIRKLEALEQERNRPLD